MKVNCFTLSLQKKSGEAAFQEIKIKAEGEQKESQR